MTPNAIRMVFLLLFIDAKYNKSPQNRLINNASANWPVPILSFFKIEKNE